MIRREAHLLELIFVFFQHLLAGEEGDYVQLVLGDDTEETQDCADELQLEIEDLFDDVDVVLDGLQGCERPCQLADSARGHFPVLLVDPIRHEERRKAQGLPVWARRRREGSARRHHRFEERQGHCCSDSAQHMAA